MKRIYIKYKQKSSQVWASLTIRGLGYELRPYPSCTPRAGKHGRGTRGAAPASDAAGRGDAQGTPLPARPVASSRAVPRGSHVVFTDASQRGFDARRREPNRADSGLNRPYRPESAVSAKTTDSGRNSKKKKKETQNASFYLTLTLLQPSFT